MKLLSILILLLLASPAWGATRTVCATGCDYTSLQAASNASAAGDIIDGQGETFAESFVVATSGTSGSRITYRNFMVNAVGLDAIGINGGAWGEGNYTTWENVSVINADATKNGFQFFNNIGVTMTNCSATGNGGSGVLFGASTASHGTLTITGGTFNGNSDNGIIVYGGSTGGQDVRLSNITITGVTASSNLGAGIYVLRTDTATIAINTIDSNGDAVDGSEDYGIAINCCDDCTISGNTITNTTTPGSGAGVQIYSDTDANGGTSNNLIFEHNKIIGTTGSMPAISFTPLGDNSAPNAIIRSNIIAGASGRGISLYHEGGGTPSAPSLYNNTITGNTGSAILNSGGVFSATIRNNIFSSNGAPELDFADASAGLTTSNNLWYRASGNVLAYNGSTYTTANISTFEATAVASDPLLNAAYGLAGNSPAKDAGAVLYTYVAHPGDYYGRKIYGNGPDIGAVEYEDHTPGGWFFEFFMPTIMKLCASTNAACYTQP